MPTKKQVVLEKKISEIAILNNKKLSPYLEMVNFTSRNIDQKSLGTLLAIFEIKDTSEDSAYIVNFLASVAKKAYFSGKKKTATDSFEFALSRINLSLAELARHGNVNWIGKIDAVICSIVGNQINFSVCGDAKILLLRNNKLLEISTNLSPKDNANNPLKTFTDIASGRLEKNDKLFLTTDDITHVFTLADLENHALSFSNKKFIRFLKTALINELEIAGTIIVDISEKTLLSPKKVLQKKEKNINVFSSATFEKKESSQKTKRKRKTPTKKSPDFTNKKTGHIYIKNSKKESLTETDNKIANTLILLQEKLFEIGLWLKDRYFRKGFYKAKKIFTSLSKVNYKKYLTSAKNIFSENIFIFLGKGKNIVKKIKFSEEQSFPSEYEKETTIRKFTPKLNIKNKFNLPTIKKFSLSDFFIFKKIFQVCKKINNFFPHISLIRKKFNDLNFKQKIGAIIIIMAILTIPYFLIKLQKNDTKISINKKNLKEENSLSINPNSKYHQNVKEIFQSDDKILGLFVFKGKVFVIENYKITNLSDNQKEYPLPSFFKKIKSYSFMRDLNLLFLLDEQNQLISFSPISQKFKKENISIPKNSQISTIGTYLTYIYLLDKNNNQIYRYPRADGGFGDPVKWLKDNTNIKNTTVMIVDGNIFLLDSNNILKLSKGKNENFEAKIDKNSALKNIFTDSKLPYLYIIDNLNGEIILLNKKDGNSSNFISNQKITQANYLWVNSDTFYFATDKNIFTTNLKDI